MHQIEVTSKLRGSHLLEACSHRLEKLEIGADSRSGRFHNGQNGSGTKWRQLAPIIFTSIQLLHYLNFFLTSPNWSKKCANHPGKPSDLHITRNCPFGKKVPQNTSGYPPQTGNVHLNRPLFKKGLPLLPLLALHCEKFLSQWLKMFGVEVLQLRCYKLLFLADGVNYAQFIPPLKVEQPRAA